LEFVAVRSPIVLFPIVLVLQVCPTATESQSLSVGGSVGVVAGAVWFEDDESNEWRPKPGFRVGGVAAYEVSSILSLHAELAYVQKGWTEHNAGGGRRLTYLEVPVLLALRAPWTTAPELLAGPSVSLELGCSVTGVPDMGSVSCDDARVAWHRRKAQVGMWFGLGLRRGRGRRRLDVQLLFNLGLTDVNRETLPRGYTKLLALSLSVAYTIPLGGS
jgi:hypothetical protein